MSADIGPQTHVGYRPDIDGMRAVAVLAVVVYHAYPTLLHSGFIGVDIFFVISGYLISLAILENLERGRFSIADFYSRRVKRIFPALLLVLLACLIFGWFWLLAHEFKYLGSHVAAGTAFVSNFLLWSESGYFEADAAAKPLLHLWSLGVEEQFYIIWPLLLWLAWRVKFNPLWVIGVVGLASFSWNVLEVNTDSTATFYSPQTRIWELLCGSALAWWSLHNRSTGTTHGLERRDAVRADVLSTAGLLCLFVGFWIVRESHAFPGYWALLPVVGTVCLIAAGPNGWFNRLVLSRPIFVWVGLISFPLYLWHWPLLSFGKILAVKGLSGEAILALMVLAVLLSWLTYKLVEKPIRFKLRKTYVVPSLAISMLLVGSIGYVTLKLDGFPDRRTSDGIALSQRTELLQVNFGLGRECMPDKKFDAEACVHGGEPRIYLWGDSFSMHLADALKDTELSSSFRQQSLTACPPIVGLAPFILPRYPETWGVKCMAHNENVVKWLATQSGYEYVVLASPFRLGKQLLFAEGVAFADRDRYLKHLEDTVTALRDMGLKPIVVAPPPQPGYNVGRCWARMSLIKQAEYCNFNYHDSLNETIDTDEMLRLAQSFVPVVFLKDLICPEGACETEINGVPLYRDIGHLSVMGSTALGAKFRLSSVIRQKADEHWDELP